MNISRRGFCWVYTTLGLTKALVKRYPSCFFSLLLFILALLMAGPSLFGGFIFDDYFHRLIFLDLIPEQAKVNDASLFGMFSFVDGVKERTQYLIEMGVLPWWTLPELKYTFWRPISEVTHFVDYLLWPHSPFLMHVHSALWYGFVVCSLFYLVKRIFNLPLALLTSLLFIVDGGHALPVSWLANRNALVATFFCFLALICFYSHLQQTNWRCYLFGTAFFLMALLSSELAISLCACVPAYVFYLGRNVDRKALLTGAPIILVAAFWYGVRSILGFGASGSSVYLDPISEMGVFLESLLPKLFSLFNAQWLGLPAELWANITETSYAQALISILLLLPLCFFRILSANKKRIVVSLLLLVLLMLLPLATTKVQGRLLIFVSGATSLFLVIYLLALWQNYKDHHRLTVLHFYGIFLLLLHLIVSPLTFFFSQQTMVIDIQKNSALPAKEWVYPKGPIPKITIIANAPRVVFANYFPIVRLTENLPISDLVLPLASGNQKITIKPVNQFQFDVKVSRGFIENSPEKMVRSDDWPLPLFETIKFGQYTVEIIELNKHGRPIAARFTLAKSLYSKDVMFLRYDNNSYQVLPLNPPGKSIKLLPERI